MRQTESGNVFIYILVAVALFAALGYTFTRGGQQGSSNISKQEAGIAASEILSYSRLIAEGISRIRVNNRCSENQISFEDGPTGYANGDAPGTNKCHVFRSAGANAPYIQPNAKYIGTHPTLTVPDDWLFTSSACVPNVGKGGASCETEGADKKELMMLLRFVRPEICDELNRRLGVTKVAGSGTPFDTSNVNANKFTGNYPAGLHKINRITGETVNAGCFDYSDASHFYSVLLAR